MDSFVEVNAENFSEIINNAETPVLVYFYTPWCIFCQQLSPVLEELSPQYELVLAKVNVDDNPELAQQYGVQGFPDVRLIHNGQVTDSFVGALPEPLIRDFLFQNGLQPNALLEGGDDNDILFGGTGNDQLSGFQGSDQLYGNSGNDTLRGGAGNDNLWGESGNDSLDGGSGEDYLWGDEGNDTLVGGTDNDVLVGVDRLAENPGQGEIDLLTGSDGNDIFVLGTSDRVFYDDGQLSNSGTEDYANITDFTLAQDVILLAEGFDYLLGSSPITDLSGTGIFIDNQSDLNELIGVVQNVEPQSLDLNNSSQFIFG